jgi:hypothetical protein
MRNDIKRSGFAPPSGRALGRERRRIALPELVAIVGLAVSTVVAATAVSVGIAHAGVVDGVIGHEGSVFTIAFLLGVIFIAMGGLSLTLPGERPKKH